MNQWYTIDDIILVNFSASYPDSVTLGSFMTTYDLDSILYPDEQNLPTITGCSYTYAFRINIPSNQTNNYQYVADLMQDMYEDTSGVICAVSPNVVNQRRLQYPEVQIPDPPHELDAESYEMCGSGYPQDTWRDFQWYISNNGFDEFDFTPGPCPLGGTPMAAGNVGADAKICECWEMGLTGNGVKVCVIATGDIYFSPNHDDLQQQAYPTGKMWDCSSPPCVPLVSSPNTGNGMRMGGIIAAEKDNSLGIAGIAPEAELSHIKIGEDFVSDISMVAALQKAHTYQADIIVTEYVSPIYSNAIFMELKNHNDIGRPTNNHGIVYGTNLISPAGHTETAVAGTVISQYPAKYNWNQTPGEPEVIGVIASNMYDKLEDGRLNPCFATYVPNVVNYAYPSNFGAQYDLAAPSASFFSTAGSSDINRLQTSAGTQDADGVAVVAGVAALLLHAKPNQTFIELRDRLRGGADKVGGYTYSGFLNHSNELAAGRINCEKAALHWPVNLNEAPKKKSAFAWVSNYEGKWLLQFSQPLQGASHLSLFDVHGRLLRREAIQKGIQKYELSANYLAAGMYLIRIECGLESFSLKAIK